MVDLRMEQSSSSAPRVCAGCHRSAARPWLPDELPRPIGSVGANEPADRMMSEVLRILRSPLASIADVGTAGR